MYILANINLSEMKWLQIQYIKKIEKKEAPSDQKIFWPILGYEEIIKVYKNFTISYWSLVQSRESLYNK